MMLTRRGLLKRLGLAGAGLVVAPLVLPPALEELLAPPRRFWPGWSAGAPTFGPLAGEPVVWSEYGILIPEGARIYRYTVDHDQTGVICTEMTRPNGAILTRSVSSPFSGYRQDLQAPIVAGPGGITFRVVGGAPGRISVDYQQVGQITADAVLEIDHAGARHTLLDRNGGWVRATAGPDRLAESHTRHVRPAS